MSEGRDRNREESLNRDAPREETPGRPKIQRDDASAGEGSGTHEGAGTSGDQNKSGIDKLIDKAQEKGVFDKAAKTLKDKFGSGGGSKGR